MAYEIKPGGGTVFRNQYKKQDNHPDYKGQVRTPDGELLDIAMWIKEGAKGKFFSAKLQVPRPRAAKGDERTDARWGEDDPF